MDSKRKIVSTAALVAFLVACGGGGGAKALADVTDAMFNALVARVTANESAIADLQDVQAPNLVDANGTIVGPVIGRGNGGTAIVEVDVGGLTYVASFGPGGTWKPKRTYHTEPTCSANLSLLIDQREVEAGFWYAWADTPPGSVSTWRDLVPIDGTAQIVPGWIRDEFGACMPIQNPRLAYYDADVIGGSSDIFTPPFSIE